MDPSNPADFAKIAEMIKRSGLPVPPPGMLPPGMLPNFPSPSGGFPPPPPGFAGPPGLGDSSKGNEGSGSGGGGSIRRRGPLPSQEESLQMEQRKGKFTRAR
jgi:polyadenylation factor subunit 2